MESGKKNAELEIYFTHITENLITTINSIKTNKSFMDFARSSFPLIRESLIKRYSFCFTVLETVCNYDKKLLKQCELSACLLALESHIMACFNELEDGFKQDPSLDFESIIEATDLEYKNGGYSLSSKQYLIKASLIYLLFCEVSKKRQSKKPTI